MKSQFDHEKLDVYQDAIGFVTWVNELLEGIPKGFAVYSQLDRASTSIPLNIAEGNGKYTSTGRVYVTQAEYCAGSEDRLRLRAGL